SADTLQTAMQTYPNAKIYVYAHSLGSMNGQYALANLDQEELARIGGAYFYQGPNIYSTLNAKQKTTVSALNKLGIAYNFIDEKDLVPIGYGARHETVGQLILVDSKDAGSIGKQHMWGGYQYDQAGNVLTDSAGYAALAKQATKEKLAGLAHLKHVLATSGGGLSGAEEIFLDAAEALALTEGMKLTIQFELNALHKTYQKAIENADELWRDTLHDARTIGETLTEGEILEALASGGATETSIRTKPKAMYQKKIAKLKSIEKDYEELLTNMKKAMAKQLEKDQELARQIEKA
ncbi:hypothetical protein MFLO_10378, partial [Listeria floridensis FSL S10-1187]